MTARTAINLVCLFLFVSVFLYQNKQIAEYEIERNIQKQQIDSLREDYRTLSRVMTQHNQQVEKMRGEIEAQSSLWKEIVANDPEIREWASTSVSSSIGELLRQAAGGNREEDGDTRQPAQPEANPGMGR